MSKRVATKQKSPSRRVSIRTTPKVVASPEKDLVQDMVRRAVFQADDSSRQLLTAHGLWPNEDTIEKLRAEQNGS